MIDGRVLHREVFAVQTHVLDWNRARCAPPGRQGTPSGRRLDDTNPRDIRRIVRNVAARTEPDLEHLTGQPVAHPGAHSGELLPRQCDIGDPRQDSIDVQPHSRSLAFGLGARMLTTHCMATQQR